MREIQAQVEHSYASLRDSRAGPVYFLEHGLAADDVEALVTQIRDSAQRHELGSAWWLPHSVALVVAATEVGYGYRGPSTDFWPILSERLGCDISGPARHQLHDMFVRLSETYRGARPPDTRWARAFHLIAWPITHALLPLEFHRPIARALASLRISVDDSASHTIHRAIQFSAGKDSARLLTLLENEELVVALAKSIVGSGSSELSSDTMERISCDLAADRDARRSVTVARRAQREAHTRPVHQRNELPASSPTVSGTLRLRRTEKAVFLEAVFPPLPADTAERLRRALRRRRYAPRLWRVSSRVPSELLLSGLPFPLKIESAPAPNAPLLSDISQLELDDELAATLQSLTLAIDPPHVFAVAGDGCVARQVRGSRVSGYKTYWLLTPPDWRGLGVPTLGEVGPFCCYQLDPIEEQARKVLTDLDLHVEFGIAASLTGAPALTPGKPTPEFMVGDRRLVGLSRALPDLVRLVHAGDVVEFGGSDLVSLTVCQGPNAISLETGSTSRRFGYVGVEASVGAPGQACTVSPRSSELTVEALLDGSLTFAVESFAPLAGLELTAELALGGSRASASALLGPLPQTVTPEVEPLRSLLDEAMHSLLTRNADPVLSLHVGSICSGAWKLERRVLPCWWMRSPDGSARLESESGALPFGVVSINHPYAAPAPWNGAVSADASLLAPLPLDSATYGPEAIFSTLCVAPEGAQLQLPPIHKPRLQRRRHGVGGTLGVEELVEAYLRWALAKSDNLLASIRCRQVAATLDGWIAEVVCGDDWRATECAVEQRSPWGSLRGACRERQLGRDSFVQVSDEAWERALEFSLEELRGDLPYLWVLLHPPYLLAEQDWLIVEEAFARGYSLAAEQRRSKGDTTTAEQLEAADFTADNSADKWQPVFECVSHEAGLHSLAALILPTDSAPGLMAMEPSELFLDEMCEELERWVRSSGKALAGSPTSSEHLRAIVALWTAPAVSIALDWRGALETLLVERSVARAARFLALRHRQAQSGGVR